MVVPTPQGIVVALSSFTVTDGVVWCCFLGWAALVVRSAAFADGARGRHRAQRQGQVAALGLIVLAVLVLSLGMSLGPGGKMTLWGGLGGLCWAMGWVNVRWWRRTGRPLV